MSDWSWLGAGWDLLGRDIALVGGLESPLLSWLGAGGILLLCLWHSIFLIHGTVQIRHVLTRLHPAVARLAAARGHVSQEWILLAHASKKQLQRAQTQGARRDLDDLKELDRVMRAEQTLAGDWLSYRKTFVVEQPAWFVEPTVSTERSAAEHFSFASLCATRLNVRFYQQLPSFLTGVGLMFTFLAILIGLSKLHANGSQIEGIQGLINGLAGKFVTSVVGLACANSFMLLEKSLWYRLAKHHRRLVSLLDTMFPQKVQDRNPHLSQHPPVAISGSLQNDSAHQLVETVHHRLGSTVSALTSISQSLTTLGHTQSQLKPEHLAADIGIEVKRALTPLLNPLLESIRDLTHSIDKQRRPAPLSHADTDKMLDRLMDRLDDGQLVAGTASASGTGKTGGRWRLPGFTRGAQHKAGVE
ncbi:MAG: hypothetical protein HP477_06060 [Nitrospira sp.]|nr:hypothetical protein [Nitrospira sp.]